MRFLLPYAWVAAISIPLHLARAAIPWEVQVFASIESTESKATPPFSVVPFAIATDSLGRQFESDSTGRFDLRGARGDVRIFLDSRMVSVRRSGSDTPFSIKVPAKDIENGGTAAFSTSPATLTARTCRIVIENARLLVRRTMPPWERADPVDQPITCMIDTTDGCTVKHTENVFMLPRVGPHCPITEITKQIIDEYGKSVVQHILGRQTSTQAPIEIGNVAGRLLSAAGNFSTPVLSWSDLAKGMSVYERSWLDIVQKLRANIGATRGDRMALRVFLMALVILSKETQDVARPVPPERFRETATLKAFRHDGEANFVPGIEKAVIEAFGRP